MHLNGSKKLNKNATNPCCQNQKHPLKYFFFDSNKNIIIIFYIFLRGWCLYICQNFDFRWVISIFAKQKGAKKRHWFYSQNQKKTLKRQFWTKQEHHIKDYWNPQKVMFFLIFKFLTFKGCFWFWQYLVYFVTDWLFQLCDFFRTYLATFSRKKWKIWILINFQFSV